VRCFVACVAIADCEPGRVLVREPEKALEKRVAWEDVAAGVWWDVERPVVHGGLDAVFFRRA